MIHDPIWMDHFIAARAGMDADMARRVPWARTQVYCITEGRGQPVKIGHSIVFHVRFPNLQCSSPRQLEVCWVAVGCVEHESALKMILWDRRLWGEWFEDPTDEIKTLVPLAPKAQGDARRVMRLRGYGNAIVPQVAAEFIRASEEALGEIIGAAA